MQHLFSFHLNATLFPNNISNQLNVSLDTSFELKAKRKHYHNIKYKCLVR